MNICFLLINMDSVFRTIAIADTSTQKIRRNVQETYPDDDE